MRYALSQLVRYTFVKHSSHQQGQCSCVIGQHVGAYRLRMIRVSPHLLHVGSVLLGNVQPLAQEVQLGKEVAEGLS